MPSINRERDRRLGKVSAKLNRRHYKQQTLTMDRKGTLSAESPGVQRRRQKAPKIVSRNTLQQDLQQRMMKKTGDPAGGFLLKQRPGTDPPPFFHHTRTAA